MPKHNHTSLSASSHNECLHVGTLLAVAIFSLSACGHQDDFLMINPTTDQSVVCHSGAYWLDEGEQQMRIAVQCLRACSRFGYRRVDDAPNKPSYDKNICNAYIVSGTYKEKQHMDNCNADPDDDVKPEIPIECLH